MLDPITAKILELDIEHLSKDDENYLHNLKARAFARYAALEVKRLRAEEKGAQL